MTRNRTKSRRPLASRALAIGLIVLPLAALAWFAAARLTADGGGNSEVVAAGQVPTSTAQPQPESEQGPGTVEPASSDARIEPDPAGTQSPAPSQPGLGLENIVREFVLELWGGETVRAESDYVPSTHAKLESDDPAIRRRGEFELEVMVQLGANLDDNPYYLQLDKLIFENWDACLKEYGLPPLMEFAQLSQEQQDTLVKERGLVGERITEFEDKCWQQARIHAGKDEETDRLLDSLHLYFLDVAHNWVKDNQDRVVPLSG